MCIRKEESGGSISLKALEIKFKRKKNTKTFPLPGQTQCFLVSRHDESFVCFCLGFFKSPWLQLMALEQQISRTLLSIRQVREVIFTASQSAVLFNLFIYIFFLLLFYFPLRLLAVMSAHSARLLGGTDEWFRFAMPTSRFCPCPSVQPIHQPGGNQDGGHVTHQSPEEQNARCDTCSGAPNYYNMLELRSSPPGFPKKTN